MADENGKIWGNLVLVSKIIKKQSSEKKRARQGGQFSYQKFVHLIFVRATKLEDL
jgi:hypothetical protein